MQEQIPQEQATAPRTSPEQLGLFAIDPSWGALDQRPPIGDELIQYPLFDADLLRDPLDVHTTAQIRGAHLARVALAAMVDRLETEKITDPLTGVLNRRGITEAFAREHPTHAMFVDLDNFKDVNEKASHAGGDTVLKTLGDILQRVTNDIGMRITPGRFGGDEFVVLVYGDPVQIDMGQVSGIAEVIRQNFENAILEHPDSKIQETKATLSIGVAQVDICPTFDDMCRGISTVLFQAKAGGKNCVEVIEPVTVDLRSVPCPRTEPGVPQDKPPIFRSTPRTPVN